MNSDKVAVMVPPQFAGFMREFFGDKRSVLWPDANIMAQSIALDSIFTQREIEIQGDFIYCDSDSTGVLYVKFNGQAFPWIPVRPNFSISGFPIRKAWIRNPSGQSGKTMNLYWGYGARFIPPNQDITSIGSITNPVTVQEEGFESFSSYDSNTNVAAATNVTVLAPASNVAGVKVFDGGYGGYSAGSAFGCYIAKASAPANTADGEIIMINGSSPTGASLVIPGLCQRRELPIGRGIYRRTGDAETAVLTHLKYRVL